MVFKVSGTMVFLRTPCFQNLPYTLFSYYSMFISEKQWKLSFSAR